MALSLGSSQRLQAFAWDGRLFVYDPIEGQVDSWPLDVSFNAGALPAKCHSRELTAETLVWRKELAILVKAGKLAELKHLFEQREPPPFPPLENRCDLWRIKVKRPLDHG